MSRARTVGALAVGRRVTATAPQSAVVDAAEAARERLLDAAVILTGRGTADNDILALRVLGAGPMPWLMDELARIRKDPAGKRREKLADLYDRIADGAHLERPPHVPTVRPERRVSLTEGGCRMSTSRRFWRWATAPRLSCMDAFVGAVLINVLRLVVQNL